MAGSAWAQCDNLFFSEAAEGSSNNKYLEIYNPTSGDIDLSGYAFPSVSNAPDVVGEYEYWNAVSKKAQWWLQEMFTSSLTDLQIHH